MTWAIDEEISQFTYWFCAACPDVVAWEDESQERDCSECGSERSQMLMWTRESTFFYCAKCGTRAPHSGPKRCWIDS